MAWRVEAIEWEDVTCISRFTLDQDFEAERLYKLSVGFVVKETAEYLVLADDVDLSRRPDSPNNYGTIIPKGCVRSRRVITHEALAGPARRGRQGRKGAPGGGELMRRFLDANPHVVATARDIGLRLGVDAAEAQRALSQLEHTGEARQVMPGLWRKGPALRRKPRRAG